MSQLAELNQPELQTTPLQGELDPVLQQSGVDVWGILARRKWLVVLGLILGLGLGYIYLLQADPVYESIAQVLIEENRPPMIPLSGMETQFVIASEEAKHGVVIKSPRILARAYDAYNLQKLPTFRDDEEAMVKLSENLSVEIVEEGTHVLNVRFRGPHPDDTQKVVSSILKTYSEFLQQTYRDTGAETRDLIVKAKDELMSKLESLEREYDQFKRTAPLMYRGDEAINMHSERQADYEMERIRLQKQMTELKSRVAAVKRAIEQEQPVEAILLLAEQEGTKFNDNEPSHREALMRDRYMTLLMQEEALASRYGPDYPALETVRKQLRRYEDVFPDIAAADPIEPSPEQMRKLVNSYLASLQQKHDQLRAQYEELDTLFLAEEEAARALQDAQAEDERIRSELDRTQQLFEVVVKSLEEITLVSEHEGYKYETLAEANVGEKVAPIALKVLPISAVLGIAFGFGIAYLVDSADKAFKTPDEVSQVMRLPVVGHIPMIDTENAKTLPGCQIAPVLCTVHRPKSPQSESYRAVRTAIYFANRNQRHQVIQVTSPMPGDGKSTLGANLAVTIAQSGKSVLLLDADFRRPTLHKVFAIDSPEVGLASVVSGATEYRDALNSIREVPNLKVMACGPRPHNPSELLSSERFAEVLRELRGAFDFVLVDTPPVLAVSDPCAVAARVDGVLMTFRIHKRARPLATRARDALDSVGASVLGIVVNGIDQEAGGYYSQYRYGYSGYRYGYSYRYGQGYGSYGSEASESRAIQKYYDAEHLNSADPAETVESEV